MRVVFDLDDWGAGRNPRQELFDLKVERPSLKVTVFAVPTRCTPGDLGFFEANKDWIEVACHGYFHSSMECFDWSEDEAEDKISDGCEILGIDPKNSGFKPPSWRANGQTYGVLEKLGMWAADHPQEAPEWLRKSPALPRYVVGLDPALKVVHGHTWEIEDNGPSHWIKWIKDLPEDAEFLFNSECTGIVEYDETQEFDSSWSHNSDYGKRAAVMLVGACHEYFDPIGKVLDIGGNDGFGAWQATRLGQDVDVLDLSATRCAYARHKFGLKAICANAEDMPIEDDAYDWGFCCHTIEHIKDLDSAQAEIRRVCKRGCMYVVPIQTRKQFLNDSAHNQWMDKEEWLMRLGAKEVVYDGGELVCLAKF